jgi:crotonobetainyl-CoA:carnitine CoA-transferase CaiB-like acyl-CoA transferase
VLGAKLSGEGCFVDSAMLDGTLALQVFTQGTLRAMGKTPQRGEDMLTGALVNYNIYECADGKYLAVGALEHKFWAEFSRIVGHPEWAKRSLFGPSSVELRAEVAAFIKTRTRDEWEALVAHEDTCVSGILTAEEALQNEQVRARGLVESAGGKTAFAFPIRFVGAERALASEAPKLGADNARLLGR